jgi:hypothetical protein
MKKTILALAVTSVMAMANDTTVTATMSLMSQGLNQIQSGFMYNNNSDMEKGIATIESAKSIFNQVDVSKFIPNNNKIQVTKNINENLSKNLLILKKDIEAKNYAKATKDYSEVMNNCLACHTIVRGW